LVLLANVYHEMSEPEKMIDAIHESLKPGGRLVLLEYRAEDRALQIPPEQKMTVKQMRSEIEPQGFSLEKTVDTLPRQHLVVFRRP